MVEESWVRSTIRFPKHLHASLKREAGDQGRTIEDLVRSAVERELSGPAAERFAETPQGNERRALRELERALQEQLEKIRLTLAVPETGGHEFLMMVADQFLECLPAPVLIRERIGSLLWRNPAYFESLNELDEEENLGVIDGFGNRQGGFCVLKLKAKEINGTRGRILFDSCQFRFEDQDGNAYTGDLLLPHASVENACRGRGVLLPVSSSSANAMTRDSAGEKKLRGCQAAFLEKLPFTAVIKDLGGRYQWANSAMLKEVQHTREWNQIMGKKLAEWWSPPEEASAIAALVDEQEDLVRAKKIGYLAATRVNDALSRPGLRFPLLDTQQRVLFLGTVGLGPSILFGESPQDAEENSPRT